MKKIFLGSIILVLLVIDWFEFHDLFEPKTLPEYLTGIVSIPLFVILGVLFLQKKPETENKNHY